MSYSSGTKEEITKELKAKGVVLDDKINTFFDKDVAIIETLLRKFLKAEFMQSRAEIYAYMGAFYPIARQLFQNFDVLEQIKVVIDVEVLKERVEKVMRIRDRLLAMGDAERRPIIEFGERKYIYIEKTQEYEFIGNIGEEAFRNAKYDLGEELRDHIEIILREMKGIISMRRVLSERETDVFRDMPQMGRREYGVDLIGISDE